MRLPSDASDEAKRGNEQRSNGPFNLNPGVCCFLAKDLTTGLEFKMITLVVE